MAKTKTEFKMKPGHSVMNADWPIIGITGESKTAYLWVGNNATNNKLCFATMSGPKTLEKFAVSILKALKSKRLKTKQ